MTAPSPVPLPPDVSKLTFFANIFEFVQGQGMVPATGSTLTISIPSTIKEVYLRTPKATLVTKEYVGVVSSTGYVSVEVIDPRDPDIIPSLYTFKVVEGWGAKSSYVIEVQAGDVGPIDLYDKRGLPVVPASPGIVYLKGDSAYQSWLSVGNTGTLAQFLTSLKGTNGSSTPATTDASALATGTLADARLSTATTAALVKAGSAVQPAALSAVDVRLSSRDRAISAALGDLSYQRGINLSGAEFSHTAAQLPGSAGTDYFYPVAADFAYLASRGHKAVRLPIRWERIQPALNGPLNAAELGRITTALSQAAAVGMIVNVEIHNYARFINSTANGGATLVLGEGTLTNAHLIDLWTKLATALKGKPGLWSYGLMNEPNNLPGSPGTWTPTKTLYGFEVDAVPWAGDSATVARSTAAFHDGAASLAVTANSLTAASSRNFTANDGGNSTFTAADGPTLAMWVLVPAGTTGSNWQAKFLLQDQAYANSAGPSYNLTPGTWAQIQYSPPTALLNSHRQLSVQFSVDNPATTTAVVYVDTLQQGSMVGVVTSSRQWEIASQAVLSAIRNTGDTTLILVPGFAYSSASQWTNNHATPWITDLANNFLYEAHYYFDRNNSGVYGDTYAVENTDATSRGYASLTAKALAELSVFTNWCTVNNVQGFLGEFGWPNTGDTAAWNAVGNALYAALDAKQMSATIWAAGSAYGGGYILSAYTGSPLATATSIAATTEAHLLTTSAALISVSTRAPLLTPTAIKTVSYAAVVNDLAMMNVAAGAATLTLPAAPVDKAQVAFRAIGATSAVPLVVNSGSGDTIGVAGPVTLSVPLADVTVVLQYVLSSRSWLAISNGSLAFAPPASGGGSLVYAAGAYPARSTITSVATTPVTWQGPVDPVASGALAIDIWENTGGSV